MSLSVVVPALNEAANIGRCVAALRQGFAGEILVVDGGSRDETAALAARAGARVIACERGLARQCNAGAGQASGDALFFIAADSVVPPGWSGAIERALGSPYVIGGGFHLAIDGPGAAFRVISWGGNFRARYLRIALPDQGLFTRRAAFEAAGGMSTASLIPFARLAFDLTRHGEWALVPEVVHSSPRQWLEHGVLATTLSHVGTYLRFKRLELRKKH